MQDLSASGKEPIDTPRDEALKALQEATRAAWSWFLGALVVGIVCLGLFFASYSRALLGHDVGVTPFVLLGSTVAGFVVAFRSLDKHRLQKEAFGNVQEFPDEAIQRGSVQELLLLEYVKPRGATTRPRLLARIYQGIYSQDGRR